MRKIISVGLAITMCLALFAGCGKQTDNTDTDTDSGDTTADTNIGGEGTTTTEQVEVIAFVAASMKNSMEEVQRLYDQEHPEVTIFFNADSSGTLQTQIEEGAPCDLFFSASTKQMDALVNAQMVDKNTVVHMLENKLVLIKPKGSETKVTGFENVTEAKNIALAGEDVPVGQYARELFEKIGNLEQVMAMEINEGANVTAVLTAVAEGSNEVGIVYATDAASMSDEVEVICEASDTQIDPALYPVGLVHNSRASETQTEAAKAFMEFLVTDDAVKDIFTQAGFTLAMEK